MLLVLNQARRTRGHSIRYHVVCVIYTTDVCIHRIILVSGHNYSINLRIYRVLRHESRLGDRLLGWSCQRHARQIDVCPLMSSLRPGEAVSDKDTTVGRQEGRDAIKHVLK